MKTATEKLYAEGISQYDSTITAGGNALGQVLNGIANIKNGPAPVTNNNTYVTNEKDGTGTKTSTIIIVVAVLLVAVVGVVLFTRK